MAYLVSDDKKVTSTVEHGLVTGDYIKIQNVEERSGKLSETRKAELESMINTIHEVFYIDKFRIRCLKLSFLNFHTGSYYRFP